MPTQIMGQGLNVQNFGAHHGGLSGGTAKGQVFGRECDGTTERKIHPWLKKKLIESENNGSKRVLVDGEVYESINAAACVIECNANHLSKILRCGKTTCKGHTVEYYIETVVNFR